MKNLFTLIRLHKSGKLQILVIGRDESEEIHLLSTRSFKTNNIFEPYNFCQAINEVVNQLGFRIKEAIIELPSEYLEITQNRGYIIRESPSKEINEIDTTDLRNDFFLSMLLWE
jgi:hypothetical protein